MAGTKPQHFLGTRKLLKHVTATWHWFDLAVDISLCGMVSGFSPQGSYLLFNFIAVPSQGCQIVQLQVSEWRISVFSEISSEHTLEFNIQPLSIHRSTISVPFLWSVWDPFGSFWILLGPNGNTSKVQSCNRNFRPGTSKKLWGSQVDMTEVIKKSEHWMCHVKLVQCRQFRNFTPTGYRFGPAGAGFSAASAPAPEVSGVCATCPRSEIEKLRIYPSKMGF